MIQEGQFVSVGQGKYTILIKDSDQYLKNKYFETFIFNWDTEHGKPETWSEDGFKVDYESNEKDTSKSADIEEAAALVFSEPYDAEEPPEYKYEDGRFYTGAVQMINGEPHDAAGQRIMKTEAN
jgi:hypothetical protein